VDHLREALKVLDAETNPLETANALALQGRFHHLAGRHDKAIELLEQAATLVKPIAAGESITTYAASTISALYGYLAGAYQHFGQFADADRAAWSGVKFGEAHNVLFAQALGLEFLSEDAINSGDHLAGLSYAEREADIAAKLHSRERRAWSHFGAAMNAMGLGRFDRAEQEFVDGIALADSIGERRAMMLMKGSYATLLADLGSAALQRKPRTTSPDGPPETEAKSVAAQTTVESTYQPSETGVATNFQTQAGTSNNPWVLLESALKTALSNFQEAEATSLLYSRTEGHRCLAHVHLRRGELKEAERICEAELELVKGTESRISRLWLGPVYIETLLALGKHERAAEHLAGYRELVAACQTPRFTREAERLLDLIKDL
jgi:tetratricopeptide (TPR) repeat protein